MTISDERIEPRHEVAASNILNTHTHGIVRECDAGPIEEVTGHMLVRDMAAAFAAFELRGKIEGLNEARKIADWHGASGRVPTVCALDARLASLQPEVAKREEGK